MISTTDPMVADSPVIWWESLIRAGTIDATSSAAGHPVTGLQNGYTTDPWKPAAMPATVTLTLAIAGFANAVCFAGHDMHSKGVTIILDRLVGADWVHVATGAPQRAGAFILSFPAVSATQWRLRFTGDNTFRLAVCVLGRGLFVPGRIQPPHKPLFMASEVELIGGSQGSTGEFLQADFRRSGAEASLDFGAQYPDFIKSEWFLEFREYFNRGGGFFIACFPRHEPRDVGYVWRNRGSLIPGYSDAVFMPLSLDVALHVG